MMESVLTARHFTASAAVHLLPITVKTNFRLLSDNGQIMTCSLTRLLCKVPKSQMVAFKVRVNRSHNVNQIALIDVSAPSYLTLQIFPKKCLLVILSTSSH